MNPTRTRGLILNKIKQALSKKKINLQEPNFSSPVFRESDEKDLSILFAENLLKTQGEFIFCESGEDFIHSLNIFIKKRGLKHLFVWEKDLQPLVSKAGVDYRGDDGDFHLAEAGITSCEYLIARTGSILLSSSGSSGRRLSIFPPVHIVVAYTSQIVYDIQDGLTAFKKKRDGGLPSMISLISGPSRTADIEKTVVMGAHGPRELILFLIDDNQS